MLDKPKNGKIEAQDELTKILYSILNKLDNKSDTNLNEFIKQQDFKNKIIINKLDKLIQAIT